jgi:hypothetical protein
MPRTLMRSPSCWSGFPAVLGRRSDRRAHVILATVLALASVALPLHQTDAQASGRTPCSLPEYRQFDFWVGEWVVTGADGKLAGTNTIDRLFNGCAIQEHWIGSGGSHGTSINTYDVSTSRWHQSWVDDQGQLLLLDGHFADGAMTLTGEATSLTTRERHLNRIIWRRENGDPNRVRQVWDVSPDGGKTWKTVFNGLYTRKSAAG